MDNDSMGQLIAELRRQNGMSQKQLSEKLNIDPSTLCKWERGRNEPDFESLCRLSDIFHISGDALMHPETTLQQIRDGHYKEETGSEVHDGGGKKKSLTIKKRLLAVSFILAAVLLLFGGYLIYRFQRPGFEIIDTQYQMVESQYVYEISILYIGNVNLDDYYAFIDKYLNSWKNHEFAEDADSVHMYFYHDREKAENWDWPDDEMILMK